MLTEGGDSRRPLFIRGNMRYNIRLTIKAIIRAEQMLGKPFTDFDYTDREELFRAGE